MRGNLNIEKNKQIANWLIVYAGHTTTADIMCSFMHEFAGYAGIVARDREAINITSDDIKWSDVVVVVRGADYFLAQIIKAAHKANRLCIFYIDDDLLSLYHEKSVFARCLLACLENADILWTSNKNVTFKYKKYISHDVKTIETVVLEPWKEVADYKTSGFGKAGIVFAGSPAHESIVQKYIVPALEKVYEKNSNIYALFIGFKGTSIDRAAPFIKTTPWFDNAADYRSFVTGHGAQIGLAVIEENEFTKCKFYNKYLEYTKLGIAGIYSDCEPYTFVIKNKDNGILTKNTVDGWANAIFELISDEKLRDKCVKNAQADLMQNFSMNKIFSVLHRELNNECSYGAPSCDVVYSPKLTYYKWLLVRYIDVVKNPKNLMRKLKKEIEDSLC